MKITSHLRLGILFCILAIPGMVRAASVPEPVEAGFRLLQQGRARDALMEWGTDSLWTNQQEFIKSSILVLGVEAVDMGDLKDLDEIDHVQLTPSIDLYWYALVYERGVLYLWFEVLSRDGRQIITSMSRYNDVREVGASMMLFDAFRRQ